LETAAQRGVVLAALQVLNELIKPGWDVSGDQAPALYALITALLVIALFVNE
jgi:hypothetical protein